uniref:Uncharacterized protein n=1 Tax=Junco hyemalis TaxID=40217 RepID=A0A8C5JTZ8_JUNHY
SHLCIFINSMARSGGIPAALKVKPNAEFPLLKDISPKTPMGFLVIYEWKERRDLARPDETSSVAHCFVS